MSLRIRGKRPITSIDELDAAGRDQLVMTGRAWSGQVRTAEAWLADAGEDATDEESSFKGYCHRAQVVEGDQHVYDAWFVMVDSGVFFRAGTTDAVAYIIQFGLECEDAALRDQLGAALVEAQLLPAGDGSYQRFARVLAEQTA